MKYTSLVLAAAAVLASTVSPSAHHGMREYDENRIETVQGTVVKFDIRNPHSIVYVDCRDADGKTEHWKVEWVAALQLKHQGVVDHTLNPGDRLVITGNPSQNPAEHALKLRTVVRPSDGWRWSGAFK